MLIWPYLCLCSWRMENVLEGSKTSQRGPVRKSWLEPGWWYIWGKDKVERHVNAKVHRTQINWAWSVASSVGWMVAHLQSYETLEEKYLCVCVWKRERELDDSVLDLCLKPPWRDDMTNGNMLTGSSHERHKKMSNYPKKGKYYIH